MFASFLFICSKFFFQSMHCIRQVAQIKYHLGTTKPQSGLKSDCKFSTDLSVRLLLIAFG